MEDRLVALQGTEVSEAPPSRSHLLQKQMPGLDVLRGVAVLSVVFYHGFGQLPEAWDQLAVAPMVRHIHDVVLFGWLGVNLFFILSGFLITGILLDTRSRDNYYRSFYVRRVLRILPFYLVILVLLRVALHSPYAYLLMCLLYVANFAMFVPELKPQFGPLWSLAVEEQFYLVWPLLIQKMSRRGLARVCVALMIISPILRGLSVLRFHWLGDVYTTTWLISDYLAWGALIAIWLRSPGATSRNVKRVTALLGVGGGVLLGMFARLHLMSRSTPAGATVQLLPFLMLFSAMLLLALRYGANPHVLRWGAPLRFFGYISYGLYLLHALIFDVTNRLGWVLAARSVTLSIVVERFVWGLTVSTVLCFLSRRYFEEFFLRFKERLVPYHKRG